MCGVKYIYIKNLLKRIEVFILKRIYDFHLFLKEQKNVLKFIHFDRSYDWNSAMIIFIIIFSFVTCYLLNFHIDIRVI